MDPEKALYEITKLAVRAMEEHEEHVCSDVGYELALSIMALDEWLTKGGFKPKAWRHE